MTLKKYLVALLLMLPLITHANESPTVMYDFIPYLGAKAPSWITDLDKEESQKNKIIKTIVTRSESTHNEYVYTLFDDILYSVEIYIGDYTQPDWRVENRYEKLAVAAGIANNLQANGFKMESDRNDSKVRFLIKGDVSITLDNYQTQYKTNSEGTRKSAIYLGFINSKFSNEVFKHRNDLLNRLSIEHKATYQDIIGK